jgi:polyhydroxyalkanoate synthesis regulator phasin
MITNIQYEINQFFNELDKALPANHPLIVKYGPADTFREIVEDLVEEVEYAEDEKENTWKLKRDIEEAEDDLENIKRDVDDVIDNLEDIDGTDSVEDIMSIIKDAIRDLKDAI